MNCLVVGLLRPASAILGALQAGLQLGVGLLKLSDPPSVRGVLGLEAVLLLLGQVAVLLRGGLVELLLGETPLEALISKLLGSDVLVVLQERLG